MDVFMGENRPSDHQVVHLAEVYQPFSITVHYSSSMLTHNPLPIIVGRTNLSINITSYNQKVILVHLLNNPL